MSQDILVHDTRLEGSTPTVGFMRHGGIQVSGSSSLSGVLNSLASVGSKEKIGTLTIMAHGVSINGTDRRAIQLCKEYLHPNNVGLTRVLNGNVNKIILNVCQVAVVTANYDGRAFCKSLARYTGAIVVASDANQDYSWGEGQEPSPYEELMEKHRINFGDWEGGLWEFHPDSTVKKLQ